jgi:uncharacterized protein (DUF433 family)
MATTVRSREDTLIEQHIDANPRGLGPAEARLLEYGTSVWALVAYLEACGGDVEAVATDYEVPMEAVEAALAYYRRNKAIIDARLTLNSAR